MLDDDILYSIFSGKALLFLGAGFSLDAKRVVNGVEKSFPKGRTLADELLSDLGMRNPDGKDLATCAAYYEGKKTRKGLLHALGEKLEVKKAQKFHYDILSHPWWRIYTTNYDNLIQMVMPADKKLRRTGLRDTLPDYTPYKTDCLYINGFLDFKDIDNSEIIITKNDYSSSLNFVRDAIIANFLDDVIMVEKVFFIGYSLYDIEVAKILQNNTSIRNKVYFIVEEELNEIDEQELKSFGSVVKIGAEKFSQVLDNAANCYAKLPPIFNESFFSLEKYELESQEKNENVFELFMYSRINRKRLKRQIGAKPLYAVPRSQLEEVRQRVLTGHLLTGIHARLCNGKTIFLEELAATLSDSMPVYFARTDAHSLGSDLIGLSKRLGKQKATILVDGYGRAFPHLERAVGRLSNLAFIIAERTPVHRMLWNKISNNTPDAASFSLNQLEATEKECFVELIRNNGLNGESEVYLLDKFDSLYGNAIGRAIFSLIKNSEVARRHIEKFRKDIDLSKTYEDELYAAVMLSIIDGGRVSKSLLNRLLLRNTAYSSDFCQSRIFEDMLEEIDNYVLCGSGLSLEIAKFIFQPDKSLEVLIRIVKFCLKNPQDKYLVKLCEQCLRFFYLEKVFPEENFKNNVNIFYETIRKIGNMGGHPLFWLQFAIAKFNQKEYFESKRYLDTAAESAKSKSFDPFQIENFRARLLLASDPSIGIEPWERFSEARVILLKQANEINDDHLYRSASALNSFLNAHINEFDNVKLKVILQFAQTILDKSIEATEEIKRDSRYSLARLTEARDKVEKKLRGSDV